MSSNSGNGDSSLLAEVGAAVVGHEMAAVQTPEQLARAAVASAERLLGRPMTQAEVAEYSAWYERVVAEFARIGEERV